MPSRRSSEPLCAPANTLRSHGPCDRPPPLFHSPARAAPAPRVAELPNVDTSSTGLQTTLTTSRLQLFVLQRPFLEAFVSSRAALSRLVALSVPDEWPVTSELIPFV